jgi:hypothetical protein
MSVVGRSPVSDVVKSLKALDPKWPIREADIGLLALQWQGKTTKHQSARPNARGLPSHGETGLLVGSNEQRNKMKSSIYRALVWSRAFYLAAFRQQPSPTGIGCRRGTPIRMPAQGETIFDQDATPR